MKRALLTILTVCLVLTHAISAANAEITPLKDGGEKFSEALQLEEGKLYFMEKGRYVQWYYFVANEPGTYHITLRNGGKGEALELTISSEYKQLIQQKMKNGDYGVARVEGEVEANEKIYIQIHSYWGLGSVYLSICGPHSHAALTAEKITKQPTCGAEGCAEIKCEACDTVVSQIVLPANGVHTPGEERVVTAATCTTDGKADVYCSVCHKKYDEKTIPATGHQLGEWNVLTQPTCTEEGVRAKVCPACGEVFEMGAVPALGHSFGSWTVTQMPTATEPGIQSRTCSRCGETEMKALVLQTSGK